MKNPLSPFTIAISGDFGEARSHENVKRWIENNGGKYATAITKDTTHLICTREHYKRKVTMVKQAEQHKHIKIVTFDWLEDSLLSCTRKREGRYLLQKLLKAEELEKKIKKAAERRKAKQEVRIFNQGVRKAQNDLGSSKPSRSRAKPNTAQSKKTSGAKARVTKAQPSSLSLSAAPMAVRTSNLLNGPGPNEGDFVPGNHHIYRDPTGFDYDIVLYRIDIARNVNERFKIRIFESNHRPPSYSLTTTHLPLPPTPPSPPTIDHPINTPFEPVFATFQSIFLAKTGVAWEERLTAYRARLNCRAAGQPWRPGHFGDSAARAMGEFKTSNAGCGGDDSDAEPWLYGPPTGNKPKGLMPDMGVRKVNSWSEIKEWDM
ncbi:hypothetical protein BDY21DRAFT_375163 [Lineolata rhizophorae]|uniref:Uncharacterized protein n=1 Tax=Lineolata rhizophorae TaxID=578093 RepID=A0A6A6NMN5_9PEZI|nr:hypothetical protein BDY21DRAFT_375163 [Lineolata rhizophorae]